MIRTSGYTYKFVTKLSSARVLDVCGSNMDIWDDYSGSDEKFTLSRNSDGTYYIKYGSKYIVVEDGKNVGLSTSSTCAKWSFDEVTKNDADIFGFNYVDGKFLFWDTNYDSTGSFSEFKAGFKSAGYSAYSFTNTYASTAYKYLKTDSIWVFRGHGVYTGSSSTVPMATIAFLNNDGDYQYKNGSFDGYITANSAISSCCPINKLSKNELSNQKCVMYIGCGTGVDYTYKGVSYNLVSATYNKGANFVLGTKDKVSTSKATNWTKQFSSKASQTGSTIADCMSYASYYIGDVSLYIKGDKNCRLNY